MLKEESKSGTITAYEQFETEVISHTKGMPIPDLASFICDNKHWARFYFYYLIFYLKLILTEYYSKGLGAKKFRPVIQGFFPRRTNVYLKLMSDLFKFRGKYLPSRYLYLKNYNDIIHKEGHESSHFDGYDEDDYLEINPEERERVQKIRNEAYEDIFAYKEFRYYETHIREEIDCETSAYSYIVPKMYESYTWTRDKLVLLTEDLLELFNIPPDGALGTLVSNHSLSALLTSIVGSYSGLAYTFKQQIPLMGTRPNQSGFSYSKDELENLRSIGKTLSYHFSEGNHQRWEQLRFFSLHSGNRWVKSDHNPYNPHNSPTNHHKDLEILSWFS